MLERNPIIKAGMGEKAGLMKLDTYKEMAINISLTPIWCHGDVGDMPSLQPFLRIFL